MASLGGFQKPITMITNILSVENIDAGSPLLDCINDRFFFAFTTLTMDMIRKISARTPLKALTLPFSNILSRNYSPNIPKKTNAMKTIVAIETKLPLFLSAFFLFSFSFYARLI